MNRLKNYEIIQTEDGSKTLYSKSFDETCHSKFGAILETDYIYIKGTNLVNYCSKNDSVHILELGFGTGTGFDQTYKAIKSISNTHISFYSLEIDKDLIYYSIESTNNPIIKNLVFDENTNSFQSKDGAIELKILIGDARTTVKMLNENMFNIVYQDAFSPKKCPALWSVEWFEDLKRISNDDVTMSTYSSSSAVRKSMIEAGWKILPYTGFSGKKESTVSKLIGKTDLNIEKHLSRSPTNPIRDIDLF